MLHGEASPPLSSANKEEVEAVPGVGSSENRDLDKFLEVGRGAPVGEVPNNDMTERSTVSVRKQLNCSYQYNLRTRRLIIAKLRRTPDD
jgi:hypothetical protein